MKASLDLRCALPAVEDEAAITEDTADAKDLSRGEVSTDEAEDAFPVRRSFAVG